MLIIGCLECYALLIIGCPEGNGHDFYWLYHMFWAQLPIGWLECCDCFTIGSWALFWTIFTSGYFEYFRHCLALRMFVLKYKNVRIVMQWKIPIW